MMAVDRRMLPRRRLVPALLECVLLLHVIGYVPSVAGDCIWYGTCSETNEYKKVNCYYDGPARPVQEETRPILDKYCPKLASGPVCCDSNQLRNLDMNILLFENIVGRCRPCMDNFMQHICGMTCSPNQSDFIKPVSIEQFNSTHRRVKAIDYFLSATYKKETYDSCKDIHLPENPEMAFDTDAPKMAFDLMCGEYGAENCTADLWFELMGDSSNFFVPFQINYVGEDEPLNGHVPYNPPIRKRGWNEEGCQEIKPTTREYANKDDIETTTYPNTFDNNIASENKATNPEKTVSKVDFSSPNEMTNRNDTLYQNNSTISKFPNYTASLNQFNANSTQCPTYKEMVCQHEQRKLQVEEDYYSFKKDYLRQKLVLLREQTEILKTVVMEFKKMVGH